MTVIPDPLAQLAQLAELAELAEATDAEIEDAVKYADPMVLRGLLYQLTGDDAGARMAVKVGGFGPGEVAVLANASDLELLQAKAAAFLKTRRDAGTGDLGAESPERLPRSLALWLSLLPWRRFSFHAAAAMSNPPEISLSLPTINCTILISCWA